ncbi:unnamed protein product, partial [Iphiclides podalirius]
MGDPGAARLRAAIERSPFQSLYCRRAKSRLRERVPAIFSKTLTCGKSRQDLSRAPLRLCNGKERSEIPPRPSTPHHKV